MIGNDTDTVLSEIAIACTRVGAYITLLEQSAITDLLKDIGHGISFSLADLQVCPSPALD